MISRRYTMHVEVFALCRAVLPVADHHKTGHVAMFALCRAFIGSD